MKPSQILVAWSLLTCAAAAMAAPPAPARIEGMRVDLSDLDLAKSRTLRSELRRTDGDLREEMDAWNRPTGTLITDPADLAAALDRLVARGEVGAVDLNTLGAYADLTTLVDALRHRAEAAQTVGPETAAAGIEQLYRSELNACAADPTCLQRVEHRYPGVGEVVTRLRAGSNACEQASLQYSTVLQGIADAGGNATLTQASNLRLAGAKLDNACLSVPWDPDGPEVARSGGGPAAQGALNATALIEIAGTDQPFCGGLFLSTREVVTTLHCFARAEEYQALKDGRVVVRQMGPGRASPAATVAWVATAAPMPPPTLVGRRDISVAEDVIRLRLVDGPAAIPQIATRAPTGFSNAFVPGYFLTRDKARRPVGSAVTWDAATPEWWKGVRWAKPGTCMVIDAEDNCFRMMCQTTFGYSGTPVFSTERDPSGALILFGLVKGTEGGINICRPQPLEFSTLGIRSSSE